MTAETTRHIIAATTIGLTESQIRNLLELGLRAAVASGLGLTKEAAQYLTMFETAFPADISGRFARRFIVEGLLAAPTVILNGGDTVPVEQANEG